MQSQVPHLHISLNNKEVPPAVKKMHIKIKTHLKSSIQITAHEDHTLKVSFQQRAQIIYVLNLNVSLACFILLTYNQ